MNHVTASQFKQFTRGHLGDIKHQIFINGFAGEFVLKKE